MNPNSVTLGPLCSRPDVCVGGSQSQLQLIIGAVSSGPGHVTSAVRGR